MKKLFLAMLSLAILAGCSKETSGAREPQVDITGKAFMALSLLNGSTGTRANTEEPGSAGESKVTTVTVLLFDEMSICLGSVNTTGQTVGNSNGAGATPVASDPFLVPATTKRIFVALNPNATLWDLSDNAVKNKSWNQINATLTTVSITDISQDNAFMMASAGALATGALTDVSTNIVKPHSQEEADINDAKNEAKDKAASIKVDRLAAKVTVTESSPITVKPTGAKFTFNGWEMNVTNKSAKLYTELVPYTGTTTEVPGIYRRDKNYLVGEQPAIDKMKEQFNYLTNVPLSDVNRASGTIAYCIENTMDAPAQQLGYTTKVVVKAQYTPNGIAEKASYFAWNGAFYTLATLQTAYGAAPAGSGLKVDLPKFLIAAGLMLGSDDADSKVADLTEASFTATTGILGRYQAVRYYHQSVCYYDVLIRHDQSLIANMVLGRYGVVRNNWYSLSIDAVSTPGTPWIPDPSDPDPENPTDPTTPDDEDKVYLSVSITINPWTMWSQSVDLH